ncbi:DUF6339 family protein [Mesorhizobium sp. SP-1A]|uniref:DUF6339 family protein n=1 Tax=Mesorhizobium sp. SP-1A TaxID=3077840 RepID=UPI0028F728DE|nr:DUF6339 family protein [Mesorhizobium sp. SP-1A]
MNETFVDELRAKIKENLEHYRNGDEIPGVRDNLLPLELDIDRNLLKQIADFDASADSTNCKLIRDAFANVQPQAARDERLWAFLTHGPLLKYSRNRWPIPEDDDKAVEHIEERFFASSSRNMESRNAVARFYWTAHVAGQLEGIDQDEVIDLLFFKQEIVHDMIERPTVVLAGTIFSAVVRKMLEAYHGDQSLLARRAFREAQRRINAYCGSTLVEFFSSEVAYERIGEVTESVVADYRAGLIVS